ncbi:MAG: sugar phosphate isomerase/epimerase [Gemmatimonadetes bacterium]|nr:sugar phosphate isomerase/epimerase [Gemmatimonadota bacterium]MBT5058281.1 sugar phosphate isomerase/epimerase [Gemmatimonadota bacterium]MBT5146620.1 sugar phosphate isomerase/epimerase [Gemmatimonadota bacterium]MBT5587223.1 sugar phosphate isomerase/epimerase [Gemmatimonadota bacterium]MBT5964808.1 sugar phosphate isomerase/epimerase [Gemmatimonadota bacterium]
MSSIGVIHYNWPGYDLEGFARRASEIGYTSCELQIGDIWDEADDDDGRRAEQVRALFDSVGMTISAVAAGNDFLQAERSDWEAQVARYRRVCQIIPHAGTDIIRSDGGWNRGGLVPEGKWDGMMLEAFQRCAEFLEELNVRIALDNHGVSTNDGDWQLSLIERVGSSRLGVNLDTMNYRWFGHDLDKIDHFYEILAPHVFHTHMKDGTGSRENYKGAALGEGEIHLDHARACLVKAGYDGAWTAEYEGPEAEGGIGYEKCYTWLKANI